MGDRERLGVKMSRDWESWSEGNPEKRSPVDGAEIPGLSPVGSHVKHCKKIRGGSTKCI